MLAAPFAERPRRDEGKFDGEESDAQPGSASQLSPVHDTVAGKHFDCAQFLQLDDFGSKQSKTHLSFEQVAKSVQQLVQVLERPSFSTHVVMHDAPDTMQPMAQDCTLPCKVLHWFLMTATSAAPVHLPPVDATNSGAAAYSLDKSSSSLRGVGAGVGDGKYGQYPATAHGYWCGRYFSSVSQASVQIPEVPSTQPAHFEVHSWVPT